jgi:hypothetical protein
VRVGDALRSDTEGSNMKIKIVLDDVLMDVCFIQELPAKLEELVYWSDFTVEEFIGDVIFLESK